MFTLMTIVSLVLVLPVLLHKWSLEHRIFEVRTRIKEIESRMAEIENLLQETNDTLKKQELEQEMNDLMREKSNLELEDSELNGKVQVLDNLLQRRQFIGLILLLSNFAVAGAVAVFGSLRIRDEEEEKLFK